MPPFPSAPRISVVIATFNRLSLLERCIEHTRTALAHSAGGDGESEIIVVDGGSTDGSRDWLLDQPDLRVHIEAQRAGCCAAYNLGFRMAHGHYVMWLNDDAFPLPGAVDAAIELLERAEMSDVGMVAFYHNHQQPWNELHGIDVPSPDAAQPDLEYAIAAGAAAVASSRRVAAGDGKLTQRSTNGAVRFGVLHVRGRAYANFGLLRNSLLRQIGWLDPEYQFCGWDPDLSLKVQIQAGLHVLGTPAARVFHGEHIDERKQTDIDTARSADNERLFAKWKLPEKGQFPDPRPAYLELLRSRGLV